MPSSRLVRRMAITTTTSYSYLPPVSAFAWHAAMTSSSSAAMHLPLAMLINRRARGDLV